MNSLFNSALKQTQSLTRDLDSFASAPLTSSLALQGQISASLASLSRTLDDYEEMSRRELNPAKKEKAKERVKNFKADLQEFRSRFESLKADRSQAQASQNTGALLGHRRTHTNHTPDNPYAASISSTGAFQRAPGAQVQASYSAEEHHFREANFLDRTDNQLDELLDRGRNVLGDLVLQKETLKGAQKKLYGVANTLGISGDTIRMIERRAKQDKWIFYTGVVVFFGFCWAVLHYLT